MKFQESSLRKFNFFMQVPEARICASVLKKQARIFCESRVEQYMELTALSYKFEI